MRATLLCAVLLAGCTSIPLPRIGDGPRRELERKEVFFRRAPSQLVAPDFSVCNTSPERFRRSPPGERVWCLWQPTRRNESATGPARPAS